jgi:hypothetical protein
MDGTPHVLGIYDMKGYNQGVSNDTVKQKAPYTYGSLKGTHDQVLAHNHPTKGCHTTFPRPWMAHAKSCSSSYPRNQPYPIQTRTQNIH